MNNIITHFIISDDSVVATIYKNDVYGKVIVFREPNLNLKGVLKIVPAYSPDDSNETISLLDLIMSVMPQ